MNPAAGLQNYIDQVKNIHQDGETVMAACALLLAAQLDALQVVMVRIAEALEKPPGGGPGAVATPPAKTARGHHHEAHVEPTAEP
jgi:hypothetical protein